MSILRVTGLTVGVQGQRIIVRGFVPASSDSRSYDQQEELDMDLTQARELLRLLEAMIPLAETSPSKPPSVVITNAPKSA